MTIYFIQPEDGDSIKIIDTAGGLMDHLLSIGPNVLAILGGFALLIVIIGAILFAVLSDEHSSIDRWGDE